MSAKIEQPNLELHPLPKKGVEINSFGVEGIEDVAEIRNKLSQAPNDEGHEKIPQMELIEKDVRKIKCKHYNYPYSNCVIFALGDEKGDLDFHIRSESCLFSLLYKEYEEIDRKDTRPGDIAVYYHKKGEDPNTPVRDHTYEHVGKITPDSKVLSQFGTTGVFRHPVPIVYNFCGDSVVFMRKKSEPSQKESYKNNL